MRYLLLLIAGCAPLVVLTAERCYAWLRLEGEDTSVPPLARVESPSIDDALQRAVQAMAASDLAAGPAIATETLGPLSSAWSPWRMTRLFVGEALAGEAMAARGDVSGSQSIRESLKSRYGAAPPPGCRRLLELLDQRREAAESASRDLAVRDEAHAALDRARAAWAEGRFDECAAGCDELMTHRRELFSADEQQKLRLLGRRARFRADSQRLERRLKETPDETARSRLIAEYLDKYAERPDATASEQEILEKFRRMAPGPAPQ